MSEEISRFVSDRFFNKRVSDRIYYELTSDKKRKNILNKLAHRYDDYIEPKCVVNRITGDFPVSEIMSELHCHGESRCVVISSEIFCDNFSAIEKILEEFAFYSMPYLLVIPGNGFAFFQPEYDFNNHIYLVLRAYDRAKSRYVSLI